MGKKQFIKKIFIKSIILNRWCEPLNEFQDKIYDFKTEIYFIGKLFEKIIIENEIECFKYNEVLKKCAKKTSRSDLIFF